MSDYSNIINILDYHNRRIADVVERLSALSLIIGTLPADDRTSDSLDSVPTTVATPSFISDVAQRLDGQGDEITRLAHIMTCWEQAFHNDSTGAATPSLSGADYAGGPFVNKGSSSEPDRNARIMPVGKTPYS
jgi:hypothetical protein